MHLGSKQRKTAARREKSSHLSEVESTNGDRLSSKVRLTSMPIERHSPAVRELPVKPVIPLLSWSLNVSFATVASVTLARRSCFGDVPKDRVVQDGSRMSVPYLKSTEPVLRFRKSKSLGTIFKLLCQSCLAVELAASLFGENR